jgi:hypothetical protein
MTTPREGAALSPTEVDRLLDALRARDGDLAAAAAAAGLSNDLVEAAVDRDPELLQLVLDVQEDLVNAAVRASGAARRSEWADLLESFETSQ